MKQIAASRGRELPGFLPFSVFGCVVVAKIDSDLVQPTKSFVEEADTLLRELISEVVVEVIVEWLVV
jgi:hypothetical protein